MKRFVCMLLTMLSVAFLLPSAIAAEPGKEDVYLRILGTNGTITTGVRTTYGGDIRVSDSVIQDAKSEFVYTADGINWSVSGPPQAIQAEDDMTARSSWRAAFRAISLSCTLMTELLGTSSPWKKWIPFRRSSWSASSLTAIRSNAIVMGTSGSRMALACRRGLPNLMPLPRKVFSRQKSRHIRCRRVSG